MPKNHDALRLARPIIFEMTFSQGPAAVPLVGSEGRRSTTIGVTTRSGLPTASNSGGAPFYNLEDCSGCGLSGWGWQGATAGVVGCLGGNLFPNDGHTHDSCAEQGRRHQNQLNRHIARHLFVSSPAPENDIPSCGVERNAPRHRRRNHLHPVVTSITPVSGRLPAALQSQLAAATSTPGASVTFGGAAART